MTGNSDHIVIPRLGFAALVAAALLVGCNSPPEVDKQAPQQEQSVNQEPQTAPRATPATTLRPSQAVPALGVAMADKIPGPPLPENVELDGDTFFGLDNETPEMPATLTGMVGASLTGRLSSPEGEREIILNFRGDEEVVFTGGWNLPPVGAFGEEGDALVCMNRLVGEPTRLTEGNVPDPRLGVDLVCRHRVNGVWRKEVKLARDGAAAWLINVLPRRGGSYWVVCSTDHYGMMFSDPEPGDGIYRVAFADGKLNSPQLAREFKPPPKPDQ